MEDLGSVTTATPATGRARTPLDMDLLVHKLDRIETRLKHLEEKQQVSNMQLQQRGDHHHRPAAAAHVQLKQALISRLQILENRVLQLKNVMESPFAATKTTSTSNEIVEAALVQDGPVDAATVKATNIIDTADELIDRRLHRGYHRLQAQRRLLVKDSKEGRKKGNQYWTDKRRLNNSHSRLHRWFAMGC